MYKIVSYATSANMGPGFDSLGVCLSLSNTFYFSEFYDGVIINHNTDTIRNKENLIVKSFFTASEMLGFKVNGLRLETKSSIPQARGLGSSASCITAGVASAMLMNGVIPQKGDIFQIAAKIEGHPDNVCPNIFGGMTLAYESGNDYKCIQYNIHEKYCFVAVVPEQSLSTAKAREVLPQNYATEDVVFNIRRSNMLTTALQLGDDDLLKEALEDRIHQPYRKTLINSYDEICKLCASLGAIGTYISGAGPTIMAIASNDDFMKKISTAIFERSLPLKAIRLYVNYDGLEIYKGK